MANSKHQAHACASDQDGVCVILRIEARPGADEELGGLLAEVAKGARAHELGCLSYVVTRTLGSREHFAVHARFASLDAFDAHADAPHLAGVLPRLTPLLAAPISMEIFMELPSRGSQVRVDDAGRKIQA